MYLKKLTKQNLLIEAIKLQKENKRWKEDFNTLNDLHEKLQVNDNRKLALIDEIDIEIPKGKFWWIRAVQIVKFIIDLIREFREGKKSRKQQEADKEYELANMIASAGATS